MDGLLPIIRRKRRPLVDMDAAAPVRPVAPPVVAVAAAPVPTETVADVRATVAGVPAEIAVEPPAPPVKTKNGKGNSKLGA